jgi:hypothetical protein
MKDDTSALLRPGILLMQRLRMGTRLLLLTVLMLLPVIASGWLLLQSLGAGQAIGETVLITLAVGTVLVLLLLIYLMASFYQATQSGLRLLSGVMNRATEGDLTADSVIPGSDEIADIGRKFQTMLTSLSELVADVRSAAAVLDHVGRELVEDSHEESAMIYTAFRVHPNLVGIIPGKHASNLSGSDKRELLRITQSLQGRLRDRALRLLYVIKEVNGWPKELEFSITDIILTTLDQGHETEKLNVT